MTTVANLALAGARAGASILTVSMLVKYLGRESYGLCATVTGMASWLSVTQGGIGQSLKNDMIRTPEAASDLFSGAVAFLLLIVAIAGAVLTLLAGVLPWNSILNAPGFGQRSLVVASVWIALLTALFSLVRVGYSAFQIEFRLAPAMLAGLVGSFVLVVAGVRGGWNTALVISASLCGPLLGLALGLAGMPVKLRRPGRLYRAGLWFFIIEACTVLIFEVDIFLVNLLLGAGQAAAFALHAQLFVYVQTGILLVVSPYWAAFGDAWRDGHRDWLRLAVRRLAIAAAGLAAAGVLVLMLLGRPLMNRWSHGQIEWNPALGWLMGLSVLLQGVTGVYATALGALGVARDPARIVVVQAILNVVASVWGLRRFGLAGSAMGSLITYALTSGWYVPWKLRRVLR